MSWKRRRTRIYTWHPLKSLKNKRKEKEPENNNNNNSSIKISPTMKNREKKVLTNNNNEQRKINQFFFNSKNFPSVDEFFVFLLPFSPVFFFKFLYDSRHHKTYYTLCCFYIIFWAIGVSV